MGLLQHKQLMLVKGVGPIPGDTLSSEQPLVSIDLLDSGSGISLDLDGGWEPNIPSLKNGGVWADSPISDGRTLIAGQNTNVTETMRLIVSTQSAKVYAAQFAALQRMIQDGRDFWDTFYQIEPVYIAWWAANAPGPQYALIFNIDMDIQPEDSEDVQVTITLTIEREFAWRGIHPGGNPREWTVYINNGLWKANPTPVNATPGGLPTLILGSTINDLAVDSALENKAEQNTTATGYISQNFLDIPASRIPGDVPALVTLIVKQPTPATATRAYFISKCTKRNTGNISRFNGNNQYLVHCFNAADGLLGTDTTLAADTGASIGISGLQQRSQTTFVTATMQPRSSWSGAGFTTNGLNNAVLRGRYAVFLRARVSAAATVNLQLTIAQNVINKFTTTPIPLTDLGVGGVGNTTDWAFLYMGVVTIPVNGVRTQVSPNGLGIAIQQPNATPDIVLILEAERTSGAGALYVTDMFLMPIDEGAIVTKFGVSALGALESLHSIYDNTGYFMHGQIGDYNSSWSYSIPANKLQERDSPELSGSPIYLTPGVDNRLIVLGYDYSTNRSIADGAHTYEVKVNIVPRWSGIRDI